MIALRKFGGEVPALPAHLLPEYAAQYAGNCDFAHGHLAPLKDGFLIGTMSGTVADIYTEDGLLFYTWNKEVWPCKSPVMADPYNRIYFLDGGVLRACTTASMSATGGAPGLSYKVGVPRPTTPPALAIVDLSSLRDYPGASVHVTCWWEYNGKRYQEASVALTENSKFREYTFGFPTLDTNNTPLGSVARAAVSIQDNASKPVMSVTVTADDRPARSDAFPGGVEVALTPDTGSNYKVKLAWGVVETRAYTYTARNTWGEESPPSPPAQISTTYVQDVGVTLTAVDFSGGYRPLDTYRTYRTIGTTPTYLRIHDANELTFTDSSYKAADVLGALDTMDYESPPATLDALVRLANGSLAGFHGNTLYISEVYSPHTWQYMISFPKNVRGLCPSPGALVVTTAELGYAVIGSDPASMQPVELPTPQAGIAQRSMVRMPGEVVYASHDGFVSVSGASSAMTRSQLLFTRDDWRGRYSSILDDASMRFAHHDGCLVATSAVSALGFLLRTDESAAGQLTRFNVRMDAMFQLPVADSLYYSVGNQVFQFRGGAPLTYTWWSRDYIAPAPVNLGAGYIRTSAPVTVTVYMDGAQWWTSSLSSGYFRLPAGRTGLRWSVEISGTATVSEFYLARTMAELRDV